MAINDKEVVSFLFENYNDLTWTEVNVLIDDLSEAVRPYFYQYVIDNPTPKMMSRSKELLSKKERRKKKKIKKEYQYKCCHYDCTEPAIQSHVISKSAVLAPLANANNEMYHFVEDIESNPNKCVFKERHIDNISSFPGYCKRHDEDIFREVDQDLSVNAKFVNLSVMRVLKKRIFDLQLQINLQNEQSEEWNEVCSRYINEQEDIDFISLNEANEFFIDMNKKVKLLKSNINRYEYLYDKIFKGIEESTTLKYEIMDVKHVRSCFSIMVDVPLEEEYSGEPHFVFYLPINGKGCLIIAKERNEENYSPFIINEKGRLSLSFWRIVLEKKESLFFSFDVLSTMSDYQMKVLHTNYDLFIATPFEGLAVSNIYV